MPDPVIIPSNVRIDATFPDPISRITPPADLTSGAPTPIRFGFSQQQSKAVVKINGSVQAGLFAASDRAQCGLEFMQFAKPVTFNRLYVGLLTGSTTLEFAGHIRNHVFLDTSTSDAGANLVSPRFPFMSAQPRDNVKTRDGHFTNFMVDGPGVATPHFLVAENGEKHYLFQVSNTQTFVSLLVFLHPSKKRQPVALIRWATQQDYKIFWRDGKVSSIIGNSKATHEEPVTDPTALAAFSGQITSPPRIVLGQVVNPKLMTNLADPLPDADERFFMPIRHSVADDSQWWQ